MARRSRWFYPQLGLTLAAAAFLIVPVVLSITAGVTVNFFQGVKSGLTLRWVAEVWRLYRDTIALSMTIALACLAVNLLVGVPAAYVLARWRGRLRLAGGPRQARAARMGHRAGRRRRPHGQPGPGRKEGRRR